MLPPPPYTVCTTQNSVAEPSATRSNSPAALGPQGGLSSILAQEEGAIGPRLSLLTEGPEHQQTTSSLFSFLPRTASMTLP